MRKNQQNRKRKKSCCGEKPAEPEKKNCCGSPETQKAEECGCKAPWVEGYFETPVGKVPMVSTTLRMTDYTGGWKARWAINRMDYRIEPGLYAVGNPTNQSPVLVSSNYKMSFDCLRSNLSGRGFWILVLETYGINVWCAAGKGTFGTDEIVNRIQSVSLDRVVTHRELILPQLGAPGVDMHAVKQQSGFRVIYGPVRAEDITPFLDAGKKATLEMRRVNFSIADRIVLAPVELVLSLKYAIFISVLLFLLGGLFAWGYSIDRMLSAGIKNSVLFLGFYAASAFLAPVLLPWLPGRSFSAKGAWLGFALSAGLAMVAWFRPGLLENHFALISWFLIVPAVTSFLAMNFTGASTYTSLSGVRKEMRIAVPIQMTAGIAGLCVWLTARFL